MAELTNPINKQNVVDRFADYVQATANSGIAWGTNAYPFPEFSGYAGIFGGTTSGKPIQITGDNIVPNSSDEITAQNIYNTLIAETNRYTKIRNMRAILVVGGGGGNAGSRPTAGTVFDQTQPAYLNDNYLQTVSASVDNVSAGNVATSSGMEAMFANMRASYNTARATSAGTWTVNVCHASCHYSCHGSRSRR